MHRAPHCWLSVTLDDHRASFFYFLRFFKLQLALWGNLGEFVLWPSAASLPLSSCSFLLFLFVHYSNVFKLNTAQQVWSRLDCHIHKHTEHTHILSICNSQANVLSAASVLSWFVLTLCCSASCRWQYKFLEKSFSICWAVLILCYCDWQSVTGQKRNYWAPHPMIYTQILSALLHVQDMIQSTWRWLQEPRTWDLLLCACHCNCLDFNCVHWHFFESEKHTHCLCLPFLIDWMLEIMPSSLQ